MDQFLIRQIITTMLAIGQVEYRMHNKFVGLYKDEMLFAKVDAKGLYLFNSGELITADHFLDKEDFNTKLQKAYEVVELE